MYVFGVVESSRGIRSRRCLLLVSWFPWVDSLPDAKFSKIWETDLKFAHSLRSRYKVLGLTSLTYAMLDDLSSVESLSAYPSSLFLPSCGVVYVNQSMSQDDGGPRNFDNSHYRIGNFLIVEHESLIDSAGSFMIHESNSVLQYA